MKIRCHMVYLGVFSSCFDGVSDLFGVSFEIGGKNLYGNGLACEFGQTSSTPEF